MSDRVHDQRIEQARGYSIRLLWARLGLPALPERQNIRSPFRWDKHPSCEVGGERNIFFDYGTGEVLDTIALVERVRGCSFSEAVRFIFDRSTCVYKCNAPGLSEARQWKTCGWVPPGNPAATYYFNDEQGQPLYRKVRYYIGGSKITPFQKFDAERNSWIGGKGCMHGIRRVLYRLPFIPDFQRIFIVEGEKCADALWDFGILATTADSGAKSWRPEYSQCLVGKNICILPDNDAAGLEHAQLVAHSLAGLARSIRIVELPDLGPKGDVYDWLHQRSNLS